jgi:hypothetical protein
VLGLREVETSITTQLVSSSQRLRNSANIGLAQSLKVSREECPKMKKNGQKLFGGFRQQIKSIEAHGSGLPKSSGRITRS